jgi:NTE family protein
MGAISKEDSTFVSYLMFDSTYCRELISLGYADAMHKKEELEEFMSKSIS